MKVAAYQAPRLPRGSRDIIHVIRERVAQYEAARVSILCCPEAILDGLADYSSDPTEFAVTAETLSEMLAPLASDTVTTIVGITESCPERNLYNAAAVFYKGRIAGVYRKHHPAIHHSVYTAGIRSPIFQVEGLTLGIIICNDSNFAEPAKTMAAQGATVLFVPTNNALPKGRAY